MKIIDYIYISAFAVILASCGGNNAKSISSLAQLDTLYQPAYAAKFELYEYDRESGSSILRIKNPWQGAENINKYVFLSREGQLPPPWLDADVVNVPIKSAVCMSTSYIAFIDALGCDSIITGVSGAGFISNPNVVRRFNEGKIADIGYDTGVNYELLLTLKPDVVFLYGVAGENSAVTDKMKELGMTVIFIGEYLENSPLGKAEWIVPMGEFLDKREEAQDLFADIAREYENVARIAAQAVSQAASKAVSKPKIMLNSPWRDSWFVPGDQSYMVRLINDAGGDYASKGADSDQSRPISTETAFIQASASDIWLNPGNAVSMADVAAMNPKFAQIPAVKNKKVFNNNRLVTPGGGSDFWESGTINPHIILKDMVRIIHPELLPGYEPYYFQQLK